MVSPLHEVVSLSTQSRSAMRNLLAGFDYCMGQARVQALLPMPDLLRVAAHSFRITVHSGQVMTLADVYSDNLLLLLQEREGAPDSPVIMNPLRHNIPAHIRNAEDLKALGEF